MVAAITNTPQNISGNFDIEVEGVGGTKTVQLQRSLGPGTTNWKTIKTFGKDFSGVVANVGNNSIRLLENVSGVTVNLNQP